jgi:DNA-binding transcriptional ArsR family regulator
MSISQLTAGSRVTRQAISKHLRVLEGASLLHSKRRGRESIWQLKQKRLQEARRYLELISLQWDDALARLRAFVEE